MTKSKYTHEELKKIALSDPKTKQVYDELEDEFSLFKEMLRARLKAGKTQEQVAKTLHTTTSAISRLENSGGKNHHSPSIATLRKYANALGYSLKVKFIPIKLAM